MLFFLKKYFYSFHSILIPVFFIIHNYYDFYGLVFLKNLGVQIVFWLLMPFVLLAFFYYIFREISKASLFTSVFLLSYFFIPSIIQFCKSVQALAFLGKYSIILSLTILLSLFLFWKLKKRNQEYPRFQLFLTVCFLVLITSETIYFISNNKQTLSRRNQIELTSTPVLKPLQKQQADFPDIYYLLFDELMSEKAMADLLNFSSTSFNRSLTDLGFKVSHHAVSPTNRTHTSLLSVFNMSQLDLPDNVVIKYRQLHAARQQMNNNLLIPFFQQQQYDIINASIFKLNQIDGLSKSVSWSLNNSESMITNQTLFTHLWSSSGWMLKPFLPKVFTEQRRIETQSDTALINEAIVKIDSTLLTTSAKPRFLYAHFYLPHAPFKYNKDGSIYQSNNKNGQLPKNDIQLYNNQLEYTLNFIVGLCKKIQSESRKNTVIIVQGDHGYRNYNTNKFGNHFSVSPFSAIYFPDNDYQMIGDSIYTTNTFRIILNKYFEQKLPMLKTKTSILKLPNDQDNFAF
jgi:Sulfatase